MESSLRAWFAMLAFSTHTWRVAGLPLGFHVLDPVHYAPNLRDALEWAKTNVPFIDVPELPDVQTAFYYRWRLYKEHLVQTPEGWVVTEFLPTCPWAGKYNTIPAAAGHHISEGRWIHNSTYLDDYITFWFRRGGNPFQYTAWFAWAVWQRHLVSGDGAFIKDVFPDLLTNLRDWTHTHRGNYGSRTCFWQGDVPDAMEVSISGNGCRPTIESVMYGEAVSLLEIAKLTGNASVVHELTTLREQTRQVVLEDMWNPTIQSFAVIPLPEPSNYMEHSTTHHKVLKTASPGHPNCPGDGVKSWPENETVSVRELLAFMPWYFSLPTASGGQLIPLASFAKYEVMWHQLFDPAGFAAKWGLRTAERRSPCYNFSYEHRDCWNGPSWPYETARVLTAAANLLNDYPAQSVMSMSQYLALLDQYAKQHTRTTALNDTADPIGSGHIFEVLHPDDGYWIHRQTGYQDGVDYFHSTFIDLVLSGLVGLRPRPDSTVVLNPLVPPGALTHFALDHVFYHGHYLSVIWDADGSHYGFGAGFKLLVDGTVAASSDKLAKLTVNLPELVVIQV